MYPLDVVKTRLQLQQTGKAATSGIAYNGVVDTFRKIIQMEGVRTLYRGITAPIFAEAPKRAVKFSANEAYKSALVRTGIPNDERRAFVSGALAGITEAFINCPFELVKVRMQQRNSTYKSTSEAAITIFKNEGIDGLYRGLTPQAYRNANWASLYFSIIYTLKKRLLPTPESKAQELTINFIAGCIASSFGVIAATPFDMVKSRFQGDDPLNRKWTSTFGTIRYVYREEGGLPATFKGLTPRLLRLAPGGGIMLVAFDYISRMLG